MVVLKCKMFKLNIKMRRVVNLKMEVIGFVSCL